MLPLPTNQSVCKNVSFLEAEYDVVYYDEELTIDYLSPELFRNLLLYLFSA